VRASCTQLESYRLFLTEDWFDEQELIDSICGVFKPNHKINLGSAFGQVLEHPWAHQVPGGYRVVVNGERFEFGHDMMREPLKLADPRGVFEAKAVTAYGPHQVSCRADHLLGGELGEFKTTLSAFDFDKYARSVQWRFMADAFQPSRVTYHVFLLDEGSNGVIGLKGIESFRLYPYAAMRQDCEALVQDFARYVGMKGLSEYLEARQRAAEATV